VSVPELPELPAVVAGEVRHSRRTPVTRAFRYRTYQWLVDLDRPLPRWRPLVSFEPADHLGPGTGPLRDKLAAFLAGQGIRLDPGDRVLMLANGRQAGHVFDPLTVFWCLAADGAVRHVVLEVHNTYGERHAQLLRLDGDGRGTLPKEFYVSPFLTVEGRYDVTVRLSPERVAVAVRLVQHGEPVFAATFAGRPRPASRRVALAAALRTPLVAHRVSALIRWHGIRLWLRGLPVVRRTPHQPPAGL
jgi:DUF1365 family protein